MHPRPKPTPWRVIASSFFWILALAISGCSSSGPELLLEGEKLIHQKKFTAAIEKLTAATQLMATNAQAWNHLGLAYHGAEQHGPAMKAYQTALGLNRDLMVAHYNLGSLLLELNNPAAAVNELRSFTLQNPGFTNAWLKLGNAQWRVRDLDGAQKSFQEALKLQPRSAEALNGLGLVVTARGKLRDAPSFFQAAMQTTPRYPPALYNLGVVCQMTNDRTRAIQHYREYLEVADSSPQAVAILQLLEQWEADSQPRPAITSTNLVSTNLPTPPRLVATNTLLVNTNPVQSPTNLVTRTESRPPDIKTNETKTVPRSSLYTGKNPIPPRADSSPENVEPAPRPVITNAPLVTSVENNPPPATTPTNLTPTLRNPSLRGKVTPLPTVGKAAAPGSNAQKSTNAGAFSEVTRLPGGGRPNLRRYSFGRLAKPAAGDRNQARTFFEDAVRSHQQNRYREAADLFARATQSDPSWFEAQYNLGLAALEAKDYPTSLKAYEQALVLDPGHQGARYNFALALQRGGYPTDAAILLEELVASSERPDLRHHLSLATVYAHDLGDLDRARRHYQIVLKEDPRHPQATDIRYWLREHP